MTLPPDLARLLDKARAEAKRLGHAQTQPVHVAATLLRDEPRLASQFFDSSAAEAIKLKLGQIPRAAATTTDAPETLELLASARSVDELMPSLVATLQPMLEALVALAANAPAADEDATVPAASADLGDLIPAGLADFFDLRPRNRPIVGRDDVLQRLVEILSRDSPAAPILVGDPGSGRTTVFAALRRRLAEPTYDGPLGGAPVLRLRAERVVGSGRSEVIRRIADWIHGVLSKPILFVDDVEVLAGLGGMGADIATLGVLRSLVDDDRLFAVFSIATTYFGRLEVHDSELVGELERIDLPPLPEAELREIATLEGERLSRIHGVSIEQDLLNLALAPPMTGETRAHPGLAIERLDESCVRAAGRPDRTVGPGDFASMQPGGAASPAFSPASLIERLEEHVVGQGHAIEQLASRLAITRRGLDLDPRRPDGVFLFVGPTGVGKTALARALATELFGSEERLLILDMSEYVHSWAISRLIGPQPGYVGATEPEQWLTTKIAARPDTVLLLDEVEKAHPLVWNIFLQVFDGGRLTDSRGNAVSFAQTIIVMTSNLGASAFEKTVPLGFSASVRSPAEQEEGVVEAVKATMPPELVNRLDAIIVFRPLGEDTILAIARKTVSDALAPLGEHGFDVSADETVVALVAHEGYDRQYGARHLRRTVERLLLEPLLAHHQPGRYRAVVLDGVLAWQTVGDAALMDVHSDA